MFRYSVLLLAAASTMAGCTASLETHDTARSSTTIREEETAQLAAYAATAQLPENAVFRADLSAAAIVDRADGRIHIYNFTDKPLAGGNIWVNRAYVQRFDSVPARGHITMSRSRFYDHQGASLLTTNERVQSVDLQWDREVHILLGPVEE